MKKKKILIVEDEKNIQELLKINIQKSGYDIDTADDGEEALKKITANSGAPDLVILDVMLPKLDGYKVASEVRKNPNTSNLPIIMLTAKDQPLDKMMGLVECQVDFYLTKPINMSDLLVHIMTLFARKTQPTSK